LDQPILQRYLTWMGSVLRGNLGRSFFTTPDFRFPGGKMTRLPVSALVGRGLLVSSFLFGIGSLLAFQLGCWLGRYLAWGRTKTLVSAVTLLGIVLYTAFPPLLAWIVLGINRKLGIFRENITIAAWKEHYLEGPLWRPSTFAALMLATLILVILGLSFIRVGVERHYRRRITALPFNVLVLAVWVAAWSAIGANARFMDIIHFLGPGIIIFVLLSFGDTMLMMRTSMTDTLYEEYVFVARAKGLPEKDIRDRHASPNALLPVLSRQIINIPILLSGMVMIEEALGTGGMGSLLFDSLRNYDIPVVMGGLLTIGIIALASRLLLEIATAYIDPRLRFSNTAQGTTPTGAGFSREGFLHAFAAGLITWWKDAKDPEDSTGTMVQPAAHTPSKVNFTRRILRLRMRGHTFGKRLRENWRVFSENRIALLGLILILTFIGLAFLRPLLMKTAWNERVYDPIIGFDPQIFPNPAPPTRGHLLGTDGMGRDVFSMLLVATANTLAVAISSAFIAAIIGTTIGAISAYFQRSTLATFLGYLNDTLLVLPAPIVMVLIGARFHDEITPLVYGILYGVMAGCSYVAIVMRSQALTIMTKPFIQASVVAGANHRRIIFTHLVPHLLPLAAVQMMLTVVGAVISYGFIAFIGDTVPALNWGSMIYQAFRFSLDMLGKIPWLQLAAPAAALSLFAAAFYMVSRGLHDIAEPRLRK
jgi:ABC-type dipeptide/oligopeptide/nickel transport system permease component